MRPHLRYSWFWEYQQEVCFQSQHGTGDKDSLFRHHTAVPKEEQILEATYHESLDNLLKTVNCVTLHRLTMSIVEI